ncbi:T9SS type A sorting domain-containing protein [Spirosoma arcticum]
MRTTFTWIIALAPFLAFAQTAADERIRIRSITASEQTGQNYNPWLNDDINDLVDDVWQDNLKYVEVRLTLEKRCELTRLSLYDDKGSFADQPVTIYALNGTQRVWIGKFEGTSYKQWIELKLPGSVMADAIILHKYGNNIPQKINVFGVPASAGSGSPPSPDPTPPPARIAIDGRRWYQVNNVDNTLDGLFDGRTDVTVNTGWSKLLANYDAYYPLLEGEEISISRIRFYDGEGDNVSAPLTVSVIDDKWKRTLIARFTGDKYQEWVGPDPARPTDFDVKKAVANARYLVINTSGAYPTEMEFYGVHKAGRSLPSVVRQAVPLSQSFGVNVFEWDLESAHSPWKVDEPSIKVVKGFSSVRHYIDWDKLEAHPGSYTYNPTYNGSWNYDAMYERLKTEGIEVLACLKTIPSWLQETYPEGERDNENVPARYRSNLLSPGSYTEQARLGFQYMARYGYNQNVDRSLVRVSSTTTWAGTNTVKIGMGLIRYIECENERDKTWKGRKAYQTAREYAANLSAFYDGHKNTLGRGVGVKNADPSVTVVIGGLAAATTDYVRAMIDWCREFRGYKANGQVNLCWDVINQHLYANDAKASQYGGSTRGAAPEVSGVGEQAAAFVLMAHQYANGMPVWITEAGYDYHPESALKAISIGSKSVLETQADWILRTALLYSRAGIDRLFFYQMHDDNPANPTQFYTMGLINSDKTRKPAGDYIYQTFKLFGDYCYKETLGRTVGDVFSRPTEPLVDRYELNGRSMYMLVMPDERGRTGNYSLPVGNAATVQLYKPTIGSDNMTLSTLTAVDGKVTIPVTETPVFVVPSGQGGRVGAALADDTDNGLGTLRVYPNPSTEYVDVALENGDFTAVSVNLYDSSVGRLHRQVSLSKSGRQFRERVDIRSLPCGLYILEVRQGPERALRKIIKVQ